MSINVERQDPEHFPLAPLVEVLRGRSEAIARLQGGPAHFTEELAIFREEASGRRVLNLFAYTGSFSVYAASGGASHVTTVDRSAVYLEWARRNFKQNGLPEDRHSLIAADTLPFLRELRRQDEFDLVVVYPPTFSNRKGAEGNWDVQRDHVELLNLVAQHLARDGLVYFSNNFRRFKLDQDQLNYSKFVEITRQTIPEDYRNQRIHRCWKLSK